MKIKIITTHVFDNLPKDAKPEDILLLGENKKGELIIDYENKTYTSTMSDCEDITFNKVCNNV